MSEFNVFFWWVDRYLSSWLSALKGPLAFSTKCFFSNLIKKMFGRMACFKNDDESSNVHYALSYFYFTISHFLSLFYYFFIFSLSFFFVLLLFTDHTFAFPFAATFRISEPRALSPSSLTVGYLIYISLCLGPTGQVVGGN
jgi:hypothetical protein